jgi:hypothetical protein
VDLRAEVMRAGQLERKNAVSLQLEGQQKGKFPVTEQPADTRMHVQKVKLSPVTGRGGL